jgi:hypothetical protein
MNDESGVRFGLQNIGELDAREDSEELLQMR